MNLILKNATIVDSKSKFHFQKKDILIESGIITAIDDNIDFTSGTVINFNDLHVSRGWFDSSVCFGEPGYEERETIENGLLTASKSGFTDIILNSNTSPVLDNYSSINRLYNTSKNSTTKIHVLGALSNESMGENMAQLYDMHLAGAVGFGDYKKPFKNANLMRISLDYVQSFDGLILSYPLDSSLSKNGLMNEGETSVSLGLKGIPEVAENSILSRDIQLLEYTKGKLHFPFISSAKGLEIIKEARNKGLNISCGVSLPHLMFTDKYLIDFDTNFKLNPPLRSDHDRQALRQGLLEGTVDLVSSMHEPMNIEYKELEFTSAHSGTIGLESSFGILNTIFTLEKVISFLTKGRDLFNISNNKIKIGEKANLSLFNPNINYTLESQYLFSKSKNCAFLGMPLNGKVYGCVNNDNMTLNED